MNTEMIIIVMKTGINEQKHISMPIKIIQQYDSWGELPRLC